MDINPSCTRPFGTHTLYQREEGVLDPLAISKTVVSMNMKFCMVLETSLNVLEMLTFLV